MNLKIGVFSEVHASSVAHPLPHISSIVVKIVSIRPSVRIGVIGVLPILVLKVEIEGGFTGVLHLSIRIPLLKNFFLDEVFSIRIRFDPHD